MDKMNTNYEQPDPIEAVRAEYDKVSQTLNEKILKEGKDKDLLIPLDEILTHADELAEYYYAVGDLNALKKITNRLDSTMERIHILNQGRRLSYSLSKETSFFLVTNAPLKRMIEDYLKEFSWKDIEKYEQKNRMGEAAKALLRIQSPGVIHSTYDRYAIALMVHKQRQRESVRHIDKMLAEEYETICGK